MAKETDPKKKPARAADTVLTSSVSQSCRLSVGGQGGQPGGRGPGVPHSGQTRGVGGVGSGPLHAGQQAGPVPVRGQRQTLASSQPIVPGPTSPIVSKPRWLSALSFLTASQVAAS